LPFLRYSEFQNQFRLGLLVAYRTEVARAKGFAEPEDFATHTTMRDPNEVFTYKFPDLDGKIRSNEDSQFKNKVVIAIVTGTWCPNCHDEAQYLVEIYAKYHAQGLEIVALDFEEPEQQDDLGSPHETENGVARESRRPSRFWGSPTSVDDSGAAEPSTSGGLRPQCPHEKSSSTSRCRQENERWADGYI
jgi:thiol-disulfide isomerase/thioredoxin